MQNKRILLGITGGIAAYKIATLIRLLKKSGAEVKCIMTPASCDFISPLVVSTLSENTVAIDFWNRDNGKWENHVALGMWADLMLIAPLTANTLAKLAHGYCDNLLTATYLSAKCEVVVAPAMDLDMYAHPTSTQNLKIIAEHGVEIIDAEYGELASGLVGKGRMAEPETIFERINLYLNKQIRFQNKKVLITAGPTQENIDPVRFISNHSTGKMGYAIAKRFLQEGAEVILISGPVNIELQHKNLKIIQITSADEMLKTTEMHWKNSDIGVFTAAVADYKIDSPADQKIKKGDETLNLTIIKNPDVLKWAGQNKSVNQFLMGFALETQNGFENAAKKLKNKNLDLIALNTLEDKGSGFGGETNKITILDKDNKIRRFELKTKSEVALDIINTIAEYV